MREPYEYEAPVCASVGGDLWYPEKMGGLIAEANIAKRICDSCTHKVECAEWGVHNEKFGIWGGTTENERRNIRRRLGITLKGENYND